MTAKEAYQLASNALGEKFDIVGCSELSDRWLFSFIWNDGTIPTVPPLAVFRENGDIAFHDESAVKFLNGTCREEGIEIPLDEIK